MIFDRALQINPNDDGTISNKGKYFALLFWRCTRKIRKI